MPDVVLNPSGAVRLLSICHGDEEFVTSSDSDKNYNFASTQQDHELATLLSARLMVLEALLYAAYGSKPASYAEGKQWYHEDNPDPRCMWPEQVFYNRDYKPWNPYSEFYWQMAARGSFGLEMEGEHDYEEDTGYIDWARSVDPVWAAARFPEGRNSDFFPLTVEVDDEPVPTVRRTIFGDGNVGDPTPTDTVEVIYTVPPAVRDRVSTVTLCWNTASMATPGDTTDHTTAMTLSEDGTEYRATMPAQADKTFCSFYLTVVTNDNPALTVYDPPGLADSVYDWSYAPTQVSYSDLVERAYRDDIPEMHEHLGRLGYYVVWLQHAAPYEHGLPELLWKYYDEHNDPKAAMRRCTGIWRIREMDEIKPGLINVARWALDKIGLDYQHSPEERGESPACCIDMPMIWRWTGGAAYPHFHDGKFHWSEPLSNHPEDIRAPEDQNEPAKRTWRGTCMLPHAHERNFANGGNPAWFFGGNESWKAKPTSAEFVSKRTLIDPDPNPPGWYFLAGRDVGLRKTDRVCKAHVLEITSVVFFLTTRGLWWVRAVETCKRTPTHSYPWLEGGFGRKVIKTSGPSTESWSNYWACCFCPTNAQGQSKPCDGYTPWDELYPWQPPANIAACRAASGQCVSAGQCMFEIEWESNCPGGGFDASLTAQMSDYGHQENFHAMCGINCWSRTDYGPEYECIGGATRGYSCYLCGPAQVYKPIGDGTLPDGVTPRWTQQDEFHGNGHTASRLGGLRKSRVYGNNADGSGKFADTKSMGNRAGRAVACSTEYTPGQLDAIHTKDVAWDTVTAIQFNGASMPWARPRWCSGAEHCPYSGVDSIVPPIPGLEYWDVNVEATTEWIFSDMEYFRPVLTPMCSYAEFELDPLYESYPIQSIGCSRHSGNWPNCAPGGEDSRYINIYFSVDLNMQDGIPTLYDYNLNIQRLNDNGTPHLIGGQPVYPDTPREIGTEEDPYTWAWGDVICPECLED
jgi:hypothetical protein